MKRKAKFRVGQVVCQRHTEDYFKLVSRRFNLAYGWEYFYEDGGNGSFFEGDIRPLTKRERGEGSGT